MKEIYELQGRGFSIHTKASMKNLLRKAQTNPKLLFLDRAISSTFIHKLKKVEGIWGKYNFFSFSRQQKCLL